MGLGGFFFFFFCCFCFCFCFFPLSSLFLPSFFPPIFPLSLHPWLLLLPLLIVFGTFDFLVGFSCSYIYIFKVSSAVSISSYSSAAATMVQEKNKELQDRLSSLGQALRDERDLKQQTQKEHSRREERLSEQVLPTDSASFF